MTSREELLEELRPEAFAIAYRMLGSVAEAEDVVQEALVRLHQALDGEERIASPPAYLATVTTRLAINELRSARARRERYVGEWLPEPIITDGREDPAAQAELADSLSLALLVVLENLTPEQRAVLLLRDAFDYSYADIARIVDKSEPSVRQLASRARRQVEAGRPRFRTTDEHREVIARRFIEAAEGGDLEGLEAVLAADVRLTGDGGGKVPALARTLEGRSRVAKTLRNWMVQMMRVPGTSVRAIEVNGAPGTLMLDGQGRLISVWALDIAGGEIVGIDSVVNPDKLRHLGPVADFEELRDELRRSMERRSHPRRRGCQPCETPTRERTHMSEIATHPFTGTYRASPVPSTFAFKIRHSGTFWFRGVMPEAEATLRADEGGLVLEGSAKVESISVYEPPELRAHLLAPDFFDAANHPEVLFRSDDLRLRDDGCLDLEGTLTIKGTTRPITAHGHWSGPRQAAFGEIVGLSLTAAFDRREFGFDWQAPMPDGGDAAGWEVELEVDLLLMPEVPDADA